MKKICSVSVLWLCHNIRILQLKQQIPEYTRCVCLFYYCRYLPPSLFLSLSHARDVSPALVVELAADSNQLSRRATTTDNPARWETQQQQPSQSTCAIGTTRMPAPFLFSPILLEIQVRGAERIGFCLILALLNPSYHL
jgi:hypothetical protein